MQMRMQAQVHKVQVQMQMWCGGWLVLEYVGSWAGLRCACPRRGARWDGPYLVEKRVLGRILEHGCPAAAFGCRRGFGRPEVEPLRAKESQCTLQVTERVLRTCGPRPILHPAVERRYDKDTLAMGQGVNQVHLD